MATEQEIEQAAANWIKKYHGNSPEEDSLIELCISQLSPYFIAGVQWAQQQKSWSDEDVCKIYIKLIEEKGNYHTAQDIGEMLYAIQQYKQSKNK